MNWQRGGRRPACREGEDPVIRSGKLGVGAALLTGILLAIAFATSAGANHSVQVQISSGSSGGNGPNDAYFAGTSAAGTPAIFESDEKLVAADTDNQFDVYQRSGTGTTLLSTGTTGGNGSFDSFYQGHIDRRHARLLRHRGEAGRRRHRQPVRHLPALRQHHDPDLDRNERRQRRFRHNLPRRLQRRQPCLLRDGRVSACGRHRHRDGRLRAFRRHHDAGLHRSQRWERLLLR